MEKTKEKCLLMNGIMSYDLGKNEARIMNAMDEYCKQKLPTPFELEAMAMEKFPVKMMRPAGFGQEIDINEFERVIYLTALTDLVKVMGGEG